MSGQCRTRFLGISEAPAKTIAQTLLEECRLGTTTDLGGCLVILPGRQAIRAVSAELTAVHELILPPEFTTTGGFFRMGGKPDTPPASIPEQKAVWIQVLEQLDPDAFPKLFPQGLEKEETSLSFYADQFIRLRGELEQSIDSCSFQSAAKSLARDDERWAELALLETEFRSLLKKNGLRDPVPAPRDADTFRKYRKIVLAAVPDLSSAVKDKLAFLKGEFEKTEGGNPAGPDFVICIAAPESRADFFDEWGCVRPEKWSSHAISFPNEPDRIHSVQDPREMADLAARLAVDPATGVFDPDTTALIVTDTAFAGQMKKSFSRFVTNEKEDEPLEVYDPNGTSMSTLRVFGILSALRELIRGDKPSADSFRRLLDQECFARRIASLAGMTPDGLREAADIYFLLRIPDVITSANWPNPDMFRSEREKKYMVCLGTAFGKIMDIRTRLKEAEDPVSELGKILGEIFFCERYEPRFGIELNAEAEAFREASSVFSNSPLLRGLPPDRRLYLLEDHLKSVRLYPGHGPNVVEITGFLDSLFHPADRIILCGMNEGLLPESQTASPFLNESIRKKLKLPDNESRFARDAFYLESLLSLTRGNIHFLACKRDAEGSPMRFSSFFFHGTENLAELLDRTEILFADYPVPSEEPRSGEERVPFRAETDISKSFGGPDQILLNVTDFKAILQSPLRAFFSKGLKMEAVDYTFPELDAAALGTIVHAVFQGFNLLDSWRSVLLSDSSTEMDKARVLNEVEEAFYQALLREVRARVGMEIPLLATIQTEIWQSRIRKAMKEFLSVPSLDVLEREWDLANKEGIPFAGAVIKGKIDRIEYDRKENTLRIIDIKTGEKGAKEAHIKKSGFLDLQLPLYKMLLPLDPVFRAMHPEIDLEKCRIRCGYFRIPGDINKIGYDFWDDMDQYDDAAEKTVRQVIETVKKMKSGILPENLDRSIQYDFVKELFPLGLKKTFEGSFRTDPPPEPPDMPKPEKKGKKE
ncbi:MAG: PD-(D/E)XK nuclease family protein [Lentisphaeria bacterium]|nr:PD-(D/E)XK nuclease family protein [Lentisphaeria bacterium]